MSSKTEAQLCFEKEKQAYWAMRDKLLEQYKGRWVAVVNEQVVAIGDKMSKVMEEAFQKTNSKVMFVSEVGYEDRVARIRQVSSGRYNHNYSPAVPVINLPLSDLVEAVSINVDLIIDTGADLTVIREKDAIMLNLFDAPAGFRYIAGIGSKPEERQLYATLVHIADKTITVAIDCRNDFDENLLGRDVINEFELTVCAKRELVNFKWIPET